MLREELSQVKHIAREIAKEEAAQIEVLVRELVKEEVARALEKKTVQPAPTQVPAAAPHKNNVKKSA